jgi:hypothetical protein
VWPGVGPRAELVHARTLYVLDGAILERDGVRFRPQRAATPRLAGKAVWLVVRTDTLDWPAEAHALVLRHLAQWRAAGNRVVGVQVDFDARTAHLERYAGFLRDVRRRLPANLRLGVTGLLDWSANGDPAALAALAGTVDEVAIQTYRGRATIPRYTRYLRKLDGFPISFRVGVVEGGDWRAPAGLAANPRFRGYVVFLLPRAPIAG